MTEFGTKKSPAERAFVRLIIAWAELSATYDEVALRSCVSEPVMLISFPIAQQILKATTL